MSTGPGDAPLPVPEESPLARQLLSQAQLISKLRSDLDALAHEATDAIAGLLARIDDLETQPNSRPGNPDGGGGAGTPAAWCWRDLGPQAREELWAQLTDWVAWLRARYPLAHKIPDCWAEHPEAVEELTALWLAWQAAYQQPDAPLTAAADFHDRWLPGLLHRLEHGPLALDCTTAHHPRPTSAYGPTPRKDSSCATSTE